MLISYPILPANLQAADEEAKFNYMLGRVRPNEGVYPVSFHNRWHGGIHLDPGSDNEPIRAIADGEIVAYRVAASPEIYPAGSQDMVDTSFVLIKHTTQSGEDTLVVFYSLYMHLRSRTQLNAAQQAQLPPCLRNATPGPNVVRAPASTRIWRKDVLGFAGALYGCRQVHFEIFATDANFKGTPANGNTPAQTGFWRDRLAIPQGQHGIRDVFGDTHFVIPVNRNFVERHPRAIAPHRIDLPGANNFYNLALGQAGSNTTEALHVTVQLSQGRRIATTFRILADGSRERLGPPVEQDDYEYELFRLATALYPDCPSAGFEYLRFGRILGPDSTTRNENWQLVRYTSTAAGYIDLAAVANNVSVWSDADFPLNWQLLDEGQAANASDGICDVALLLQLIGQVPDTNQDGVIDETDFDTYTSRPEIAKKLRFLICKHPSEWDSGDLANRYQREREPGGPLNDAQAWQKFEAHVNQMAFWSQAGMGDRSVWHFHPLQFIEHYRHCPWLTTDELAQCIPRRNLHLSGTQFSNQLVATWPTARKRADHWSIHTNRSLRKYCISNTMQRLLHFLAQLTEETGYYRLVREGGAQNAPYAPYFGRGLIQLTHRENYIAYGNFRNFAHTHPSATSGFPGLGWDPDQLIAGSTSHNAENCADSAGFYWTCPNITATQINAIKVSDRGTGIDEVVEVSKTTNGNVSIQNINGLATRFQAFTFIKYILLDLVKPDDTERVSFVWRRNSSREPLFHPNGQPVFNPNGQQKTGYIFTTHSIDVPLSDQRP
ncbi:hypothetical protein ACKI2N_029025 [Cupriavidus sp. 30B13]|uniref:hypothetical protein n=1 Tax=Cupriavidus sp. 30B13 TaxID=3384241 RepID=UPI003B8EFC8A